MAKSSKRQKLRRKADRLSNLPDPILVHILSFLPTETAIATSILSKSWQCLWSLVLNLDFDQSRSHPRHIHQNGSFTNFVTKVFLHRRERFIGRFRLKCSSYQCSSHLDSWVSSAIAQNVQELDLDIGYHTYHCTQQSFKTLVVLKLRSVVLDHEASFPVLKIFHLEVESQEIKFLPSRFPVLEELVINKFGCKTVNSEICLPKLRSLAIDKCTKKGFVRIDCPALTHLVIKDENSREFHLENLLCLVEADINVRPDQVMDVVKAISNVSILRLSQHTMRAVSPKLFFCGNRIPVFHNLVQVELPFIGCTLAREIFILMLQKFENLERLILWYQGVRWKDGPLGRPGVADMKKLIKQTRHVPKCLTSRLTTFCFRKFEGTYYEMEVTRYILENSLVLEYMTIFLSSSLSSSRISEIRRNICDSPTASEGRRLDVFQEDEDEVA